MNKKADKIISVYWFAILFIVTAAIVYITFLFYGQPYNVREVEADILIDKIASCISKGGKLNSERWNKLENNNLLEICNLNFNVEDFEGWKDDQYYVEIHYSHFDINKEINSHSWILKSSAGNFELKDYCWKNEKNFPFCLKRSFYILDDNNQEYLIKILSIVRKTEKNVR
jgi:hypothetical protein